MAGMRWRTPAIQPRNTSFPCYYFPCVLTVGNGCRERLRRVQQIFNPAVEDNNLQIYLSPVLSKSFYILQPFQAV